MESVLALSKMVDHYEIALVLAIPRLYAFMDSSQLLNSTILPGVTRIAILLALALVVAPANLAYATEFDHTLAQLAFLIAKEYAIGAVLGYLVAWIFWVVQTAGSLIDNQRGASIASSIDPLMGAESSPLGDMFSLVFMTYIFATASILQIVGLIYGSYRVWPVSRAWPVMPPEFPAFVLSTFDYSMRLGVTIAAPIIAIMFFVEFALALISRFSPQVQVFFLAMPIKSVLAIFMLVFYSYVLFPYANRQIDVSTGAVHRFYEMLHFNWSGEINLTSPPGAPRR